MRIIVAVKQVRMTYARTGMDPETHFLASEDSVCRINPYDEVAIELALRLKESQGEGDVIILTLGPIIAEEELRRCMAMGADDIYQIQPENRVDDPWQKSRLIAMAAKDLAADLVLCGKESLDRRNGQVGAFIAHNLNFPFVSAVTEISIKENGPLRVQRSAGRGLREKIECPFPAVLSVDLGTHAPRIPTYEAKRAARIRPVRVLRYPVEIPDAKTVSRNISQPRPRPKRVPTPDSRLTAFDRTDQLLMGSGIEKKGTILRGDTGSQVQGIVAFLKEHGFLKSKKSTKKD